MLTRACLTLSCWLLLPAAVLAASFTVNPVRVDLAAERPYAVMRITNLADTPVTLQARAYIWTGDEANNGLTATDAVILNPPLLSVAPGATRFVRLGLRTPNQGKAEATYRLILQEVPKTSDPTEGAAIHTILRISIPVFAAPKTPIAAKLDWSLHESGAGKFKLVATNSGTAHVQIRELSMAPAEKTVEPKALTAPVYVLPGQSRTWEVEAPDFAGQATMKVVAKTDAGTTEQIVGATNSGVAKNPN
jgi:fimbrial chaperone protein